MPFSTKALIDKVNTKLNSGSVSPVELAQISAIKKSIENMSVISVNSLSDLPDPTLNSGRFIYVAAIRDYRYSNGFSWVRVYDSTINQQCVIFTFGQNNLGNLGDGTTCSRSSPVSVVGGFTDWCQVSAGTVHVAAVRKNGTLWAWGCNAAGQIGDGTIVSKSSPVSVVGGFTDWCQVSAGCVHTAAIRTNGTLWTWGVGSVLGDNTIVAKSSPVSVVGGFTDWCQVSAGRYHSAAVRANGTLWTWGCNNYGQLGHGTATTCSRSSPVSVVGGFTDWCQVSSGVVHVAAIRSNGTLWTWGNNLYGKLGHSTATTCSRSSPVSVVGGFTDWCWVSASYNHSAAIRTNGTLWTWGSNSCGQLGDNSSATASKSSPVSVVGGFTDWCQVSVGRSRTAAIRTNGTLWTWGDNCCGILGDNTVANKSSPVSVVGGFTDWCQVSVGVFHTGAVRNCTNSGFNTLP